LADQSLFDDTIASLAKANLECAYETTETTLGCMANTGSCKMITTFNCMDSEGVVKASVIKTHRAQHEGSYLAAKEIIKIETKFK
tara:strand:- start:454 stop:708 length:255 start_codon:yes stop_codon:yes gene_type:complete